MFPRPALKLRPLVAFTDLCIHAPLPLPHPLKQQLVFKMISNSWCNSLLEMRLGYVNIEKCHKSK